MKSTGRSIDRDSKSLASAYNNIYTESDNIQYTEEQAFKQGKYDFGAGVTGVQAKNESRKFGKFGKKYLEGRLAARDEFGRPAEPDEPPLADEDRNEMEGIIFGDEKQELVPEARGRLTGEEYQYAREIFEHAINYLDSGGDIDEDSGEIRDDGVSLNSEPEAVYDAAKSIIGIIEDSMGENLMSGDSGYPHGGVDAHVVLSKYPKVVGACLARALWKIKSSNMG